MRLFLRDIISRSGERWIVVKVNYEGDDVRVRVLSYIYYV